MKIKDILIHKGSDVITVSSRASLHEAFCKINETKVGALVVVDELGQCGGIITERDLMRELYQNTHLQSKQVQEIMTRDVVIGDPCDKIENVMAKMTEGRFRHLPVCKNGILVGIVSIGDVVKAALHQANSQVSQLRDYVTGVADVPAI